MPKILAVAGSLRKDSYNKRVLDIAVEGALAVGGDVTVIDLLDLPLPIYNADVDESEGFCPNALALQDEFAAHDGFLIASPEYNGSIPGGFKNAIDWISRKSEKYEKNGVFTGKVAAMITASPGSFGGIRCLGHLRGVLSIMGVTVLPSEIAVTFAAQKFDGNSRQINDEKMKHLLQNLGAELVSALKRTEAAIGFVSDTSI